MRWVYIIGASRATCLNSHLCMAGEVWPSVGWYKLWILSRKKGKFIWTFIFWPQWSSMFWFVVEHVHTFACPHFVCVCVCVFTSASDSSLDYLDLLHHESSSRVYQWGEIQEQLMRCAPWLVESLIRGAKRSMSAGQPLPHGHGPSLSLKLVRLSCTRDLCPAF